MKPLLLLALAAFAFPGCHKKEATIASPGQGSPETPVPANAPAEARTQQPAAANQAQPAAPLPPPSPSVIARADNTPRENVIGEVDATLTGELRNFIEKKGRLPQSFGEFATVRLDSIPRPPEGKKWVIDTANLQVKAVATK